MVNYTSHKIIYFTAMDFIPEIKQLYREWTGKDYNSKYVPWNCHFIVAREKGSNQVIGVAQLIIVADPFWCRRWVLVENVYVKKGYRRMGIAKGLMETIASAAITFECDFIKLTSRKKEGKALYRSLGYEEGSSFRKGLKKERSGFFRAEDNKGYWMIPDE